MHFAEKMKAARAQKGCTQEQAAEALSISRQTVFNWENGRSLPVRFFWSWGKSLPQARSWTL